MQFEVFCFSHWFFVFLFSSPTILKTLTLQLSGSATNSKKTMRLCSPRTFVVNLGWFWGDPHIKTLDGGNYTFNGLGEYVMIDAKNGTFQLQARTTPAQGNSTTATIFSAGAANEENTSTIEVQVKEGGKLYSVIPIFEPPREQKLV